MPWLASSTVNGPIFKLKPTAIKSDISTLFGSVERLLLEVSCTPVRLAKPTIIDTIPAGIDIVASAKTPKSYNG
jgi:hypothetical protein